MLHEIPATERRSICRGDSRELPSESIPRLIEVQAAATPGAVAVRFLDDSMTYRTLNRRANRLASSIADAGAGREGRVAVCVEPSFDVVIALLAIFKAGAVYVPMDPTWPVARIRTILDDTRPTLLLSQGHLLERLALTDVRTLVLDTAGDCDDPLSDKNPAITVDPGQTAYIYYTSGTTGTPKGVTASYANLASYIQVAQARYGFTSRDTMPAIARFSFSISMFELMLPLVAGGTLVILARDHILDLARMTRTLSEVTFVHAGPSLLKVLLPYVKRHAPDLNAFARMRHVSSGGDMIPPSVLEAMREVFVHADVFVIYGCSEIGCMGCTYGVPHDGPLLKTYVGWPFDNTIVRITDAAFNVVPVGADGEISFAGGGIAKGYLNRPDLTADKFIEGEAHRFYRTGDIGRMTEDGCLEVLGRSDLQVQVRGIRVEIGEVEHHLQMAPGVRDCVVSVKEDANKERMLVAYLVMDEGDGASTGADLRMSAVRRYMADVLPDYMVPARYVRLVAIPLNHNMKVDRLALPEPDHEGRRPADSPAVREPVTPTQKRMASLWRKLLGTKDVGLDDNLFELGGDSLLALKLILLVDSELGIELEGMQVLRESLEVLADICDGRADNAYAAPRSPAATACVDALDSFHFSEDRSLYGVLHGPRAEGASCVDAVLICSPVGQESFRTHAVLQRFARVLAAAGTPTLRFDYYGAQDSLGESADATCARWQRDIVDAHGELKRRTNAVRITAIGVRLGGTLLCNVASRLNLERVVLWDPICQGAAYYAEMVEAHRRYLGAVQHLRFRRSAARRKGGRELLGSTYSETALLELKALDIAPIAADRRVCIKWLTTSPSAHQAIEFQTVSAQRHGCRFEAMDVDCSWRDVSRLEEVLPDVGISLKLREMVMERA
jgi:amino acid adenylation domain-containing protein